MSTNWAEHIRNGINNYQEEALNFIKEEKYAVAASQLVNIVYAINLGYEAMPPTSASATLGAHILRLKAGLEFLRRCLEKKYDKKEKLLDNIKPAMEGVEMTIPLVELGISSFLQVETAEE